MKEESLVGKYFCTLDENQKIAIQGRIEEMISDAGYFICVLYSWMTGGSMGRVVVHFDEVHRHFILTGDQEAHDEFCQRNSDRVISLPRAPWVAAS